MVGGYGGYLLLRRSSVGWTLVFYFLTLLVWPFPSDRFLWGVLPWLALAWAAGAAALWRHGRPRLPLLVLAPGMGIGYGEVEGRGLAGRWWGSPARRVPANFAGLAPRLAPRPPH